MSDTADASANANCPYCGMLHLQGSGVCPRVKAMEYYQDGTLKRVEFYGSEMVTMPCQPYPFPSYPWPVTIYQGC